MLRMKIASALMRICPESCPAFESSGMAAMIARIIAMKWVNALPGSLTLVIPRFNFAVIVSSLLLLKTQYSLIKTLQCSFEYYICLYYILYT